MLYTRKKSLKQTDVIYHRSVKISFMYFNVFLLQNIVQK
jgi:hypothetical protein